MPKKQKKAKSNLASKLFNSKKKRMAAFVVVFGLIGATLLVYASASTEFGISHPRASYRYPNTASFVGSNVILREGKTYRWCMRVKSNATNIVDINMGPNMFRTPVVVGTSLRNVCTKSAKMNLTARLTPSASLRSSGQSIYVATVWWEDVTPAK